MTFKEFKYHVGKLLRGYKSGLFLLPTVQARALKAVFESGDLSSAIAENDLDAISLAIGNIMFCLVGISKTKKFELVEPNLELFDKQMGADRVTEIANSYVSDVCTSANELGIFELAVLLQNTANWISEVARRCDVPMSKCYESVWKDGEK